MKCFAPEAVAGQFVYTPPPGTALARTDGFALSVQFIPNDGVNYESGSASTTLRVLVSTIDVSAMTTMSTATPRLTPSTEMTVITETNVRFGRR